MQWIRPARRALSVATAAALGICVSSAVQASSIRSVDRSARGWHSDGLTLTWTPGNAHPGLHLDLGADVHGPTDLQDLVGSFPKHKLQHDWDFHGPFEGGPGVPSWVHDIVFDVPGLHLGRGYPWPPGGHSAVPEPGTATLALLGLGLLGAGARRRGA